MSSKRHQRRKACEGKRRFADRLEAQRVKHRAGLALDAYHCHFCGGWHLGHPGKLRKRLRDRSTGGEPRARGVY